MTPVYSSTNQWCVHTKSMQTLSQLPKGWRKMQKNREWSSYPFLLRYITYQKLKNRDALNDNVTRNKNAWRLVLDKVVDLKGPVVTEMVELLLPGWLSVCALSSARLSGNVRPRLHSQHTTAWRYHHCSFLLDCMCQELSESCILVLLTFRLPHSMQHSEHCKVRCFRDYTAHVFFARLSSVAEQHNSVNYGLYGSPSPVLMATDFVNGKHSGDVMVGNIIFLMIFCGFWSIAVGTMDKLHFLVFIRIRIQLN